MVVSVSCERRQQVKIVTRLKGLACCSTAQHSTTSYSLAEDDTAQHSTAQHSTAQHSTAQHSTAQHSTAQHSTAQHSTAQLGSARCSAAQHSMLWPKAASITCYGPRLHPSHAMQLPSHAMQLPSHAMQLQQHPNRRVCVCVLTVCVIVGSARLCSNVTGQGARGVEGGRVGSLPRLPSPKAP